MSRLSRATALKIAAGLSLTSGIFGLITSIPPLWLGAAAINQAGDTVPYFVFVLDLILAPIHIIGAFGAWRNQRWGVVLLLLAAAVDAVSAAPGILFAPSPSVRLSAAVGTLFNVVMIILCLWRDRPATAL